MKHELYFWRDERPIPPAADSLLVELAEDHNLPGVGPLSMTAIKESFSRHFPGVSIAHSGADCRVSGVGFRVSFNFDDSNQPKTVCISSETALVESPELFDRVLAVTRELGCTRIES